MRLTSSCAFDAPRRAPPFGARRYAPVYVAPLHSKAGDAYLRRLLVSAAQYVLGPFGPECKLRSKGLKLAERGGPRAKKKAVVAVARKLAVLMLALWRDEEIYHPKRHAA